MQSHLAGSLSDSVLSTLDALSYLSYKIFIDNVEVAVLPIMDMLSYPGRNAPIFWNFLVAVLPIMDVLSYP